MTAGYYVAAGWQEYANDGEVYICDECMWADPRYIRNYGPRQVNRSNPGAPVK